jgi:GNAT superfamily N-acetyltransferase
VTETLSAETILARYDAELRVDPPAEAGFERVWADGVLRTLGPYNLIHWWDFSDERAPEIARREAEFFRSRDIEWKVYSHDGPPGLEAALRLAGFAAGETETLVVLDMQTTTLAPPPPGIDVREVRDAAGLADLAAVTQSAFGREAAPTEELAMRLQGPTLALFVAYDAGRPVSSGRLELAPGRAFTGLFGGGTIPSHRGRGVYRALVAARAAEARRRGHRFLTVDARETSRPILERLGFRPLATICGWTLGGAA